LRLQIFFSGCRKGELTSEQTIRWGHPEKGYFRGGRKYFLGGGGKERSLIQRLKKYLQWQRRGKKPVKIIFRGEEKTETCAQEPAQKK